MDAPPRTSPTDPIALVRQLDPGEIRHRLRLMEAERRALLILLRAATAAKSDGEEGADAR